MNANIANDPLQGLSMASSVLRIGYANPGWKLTVGNPPDSR